MKIPQKNEIYDIEIKDVSSDGNGVGEINGFVVFVPYSVSGDSLKIQIVKVQKSYAFGKILEVLKPSPKRCDILCPAYGKCGGCSLMHIDYSHQLEIKKGIINNALKRIGGFSEGVTEMIGAPSQFRYRNKMIFPIGEIKGETVSGFYRERSHDIIPLDDCLLGSDFNAALLSATKDYMSECNVKSYDESSGKGDIRRIFTRYGHESGDIMVVISATRENIPKKDILVEKLLKVSPNITSIILNINSKKTNLVLGDKNIILYGNDTISDTLLGVEYKISAHSFYQVNPVQTENLYKKALEYADIDADDVVMDIYCGIGTISLSASKLAKKVVGVEIVPQAIENAKENAARNGIKNTEFYCADAQDLVPKLIKSGISPDIVLIDPPRKGSDEDTLSAITKANPKRIVYVSCNPATLARDMKFLKTLGYSPEKICGVDMFANTNHVETVVKLCREC